MIKRSNGGLALLLIVLVTLTCTKSTAPVAASASAAQAAAVAFLARANGDRAPCVRTAAGPGDLVRGGVAAQLEDPSSELVTLLKNQGLAVRPFSTCSSTDREKLTYAVGWPRPISGGLEVNADRLCGSRCGEGSLVRVKPVGTSWRATEAETTWIM
jgi:hypothetical protein